MTALIGGLVHVWLAHPAQLLDELARLTSFLSEDENARAATYKIEAPRLQFTLARGWLRQTLGATLSVPPASIRFSTIGNGKPVLADSAAAHFNLSHTANLFALAMSLDRPVGVDVEQLQTRSSLNAITRQQFHPIERAIFDSSTEAEKLETFYRIWTCKEAYLKGLGEGFARPLASFAMQSSTGNDCIYRADPGLNDDLWSIRSEIREGFALAVAAPGEWQIRVEDCVGIPS